MIYDVGFNAIIAAIGTEHEWSDANVDARKPTAGVNKKILQISTQQLLDV